MTNKLTKLSFFGLCFVICLRVSGQDLHYSQFYNSPMNLSPAQTGIFNGDKRFTLSFRDQWRFVPVPWTTLSLSYDFKYYPAVDKDHFFGFGGNLNYDKQGDSKLTLTGLNAGASYTRILAPQHLVTGGLILGFSSRAFDSQKLTWDKQWDGVSFDPNLSSGENFSFERVTILESGLGFNYRFQKSERTKVDAGIGAYHLFQPSTSFYQTPSIGLPIRLSLYAIGNIKVIDQLDIQLHVVNQSQNQYKETVFGGLGKFYLSQKRGKETQVHAGLGYRTAGSLIPTFALQYNEWYGSFSYDFDSTEFNEIVGSNKGGPEFHLRYIIKNVRPLKDRKICPIY